jgi:hypothetical protein
MVTTMSIYATRWTRCTTKWWLDSAGTMVATHSGAACQRQAVPGNAHWCSTRARCSRGGCGARAHGKKEKGGEMQPLGWPCWPWERRPNRSLPGVAAAANVSRGWREARRNYRREQSTGGTPTSTHGHGAHVYHARAGAAVAATAAVCGWGEGERGARVWAGASGGDGRGKARLAFCPSRPVAWLPHAGHGAVPVWAGRGSSGRAG